MLIQKLIKRLHEAADVLKAGDAEAGLRILEPLQRKAPKNGDVWNLSSLAHQMRQDYAKAEAYARRALGIEKNGHFLNTLGLVYHKTERFAEAAETFAQAIARTPGVAEFHNNLGIALHLSGQDLKAADAFEEAIKINPSYIDPYWNSAQAYLRMGDYPMGLRRFESRWKIPHIGPALLSRPLVRPWNGQDSLDGKTVLLCHEQGLGDTIQFCRYARHVKGKGAAKVILSVEPPLLEILASVPGVDATVGRTEDVEYDYAFPMMSLPLAFGSVITTPRSYITPDPQKVAAWAARLGEKTGVRVGLVWSGGIREQRPDMWTVNQRRNMALALFAPLRAVEGVTFYSLQKGVEAEAELHAVQEKGWDGPEIIDLMTDSHTFADTAAIIANLDLVITVDTSTAHISGAMGKPTWILNRLDSCWRWGLESETCAWYQTVRLFRQTTLKAWEPVMARVVEALREFTASPQSP